MVKNMVEYRAYGGRALCIALVMAALAIMLQAGGLPHLSRSNVPAFLIMGALE